MNLNSDSRKTSLSSSLNSIALFFTLKLIELGNKDIKEYTSLLLKSGSLKKTKALLDESTYWKIIDQSLKNTNSQEQQENKLIIELKKLPPEKIIGFRLRTDKLLFDTYNSEMWCAGYIMNGGCSDDFFQYFRCWIISQGEEVYMRAKENPDSLAQQINANLEYYDFEAFWYVSLVAFEEKTGKQLYDYIDVDFEYSEEKYPEIKFNWTEDEPKSWQKICPNLFDKFKNITYKLE